MYEMFLEVGLLNQKALNVIGRKLDILRLNYPLLCNKLPQL